MFLYDCSICCKVFYQIGDCVPLALKNRCRKRHAGCRLRVDPGRMIDKIRIKPGLLDLLGREITGELIDDRRNHFLMGQFFRTGFAVVMNPFVFFAATCYNKTNMRFPANIRKEENPCTKKQPKRMNRHLSSFHAGTWHGVPAVLYLEPEGL